MFQSVHRLPEELNTGKYDLFQLVDRLLKDVNMRMKLYHLQPACRRLWELNTGKYTIFQ